MEKDKCTHVNYNWNGLLKEGICVDCMAKLLSPPIQPSEQQPQGAETIKCPFCGQDDFDKPGLKYHLNVYCVEYMNTEEL